jgi:hypothetical protein
MPRIISWWRGKEHQAVGEKVKRIRQFGTDFDVGTLKGDLMAQQISRKRKHHWALTISLPGGYLAISLR